MIQSVQWLYSTPSINTYRLLPLGLPELLEALMMGSFSIQLVLDEESSVWCSHLILDIWLSRVWKKGRETKKATREKGSNDDFNTYQRAGRLLHK
jgi:hypothetical protein